MKSWKKARHASHAASGPGQARQSDQHMNVLNQVQHENSNVIKKAEKKQIQRK
jgi:hypothetical protein